jgi:hypothetical protein
MTAAVLRRAYEVAVAVAVVVAVAVAVAVGVVALTEACLQREEF